jgi:mono/diheme cytochrome c family protein
LDGAKLNVAKVTRVVRDGGKQMPGYGNQLSADELTRLSAFVARKSHLP